MTFHRPLLLLLLLGTPAISQTTPLPVPPAPPAVASTPLAAPSVPIQGVRGEVAEPAVPAANLGETKIVEDIVEEKLNGTGLAGLYRRYTGRRVIVTTAASTAEISFVQEASPEDPLTYAEAAELLRRAAVVEGFVFTQHPEDPNLDILTLASAGPKPTNVNVDVFNEASILPDKDVVITYVMTLSYIKPEQAVQIFNQIIGQVGAYGSISSVPNASAVVITEKASLIKSLVELKRTIDVPGSVQATRFMEVQYADASELATVIEKLLTDQKSVQTTAGVQRAPAGENAAAVPEGAAGGGAGEITPVQISADSRTNRIFAMGRPVDLVFIENLVREFDIPTSDKNFLRRKLRFLKVSEFLPVAADALTAAFTGTGDGAAAGASPTGQQSRARPASNTNTSSRSSSSNSNRDNNNSAFGSQGGSGGGGDTDVSLGDPDVTSAPESMLVGRTQLVGDNITNSIFVQGSPSALKIVERLLEQLDVKPQQVMISTVIGQLTLGKEKSLGFNYLVDGKDVRAGGGGSGFAVFEQPTAPTQPVFPVFDPMSVAGAGLRVYGQIGDLSGYIRALSSKNDFTVLSRPSIFTSNNQKGVISSGERIAIPTEGGTSSGSYSTGTRIQYEDVVLKLEVIPLVNSNNEITMQIALLNDSVLLESQEIAGAGTNGGTLVVPRIATRKILTTATVPNNQTIVLGGLIIGTNEKTKSGIPILSDIPLVGYLFSSNSKSEDRTELMVFIQPSVVGDDASLDAAQLDMNQRYDVSDQALGFAEDGSGLFSTPKSTSKDSLPEQKKTPRMGGIHRR